MSDIIPVTVSDTQIFGERGYAFNRLLGEGSYAKVWLVTYQTTIDNEIRDISLACKIVDSKKAPRDFINKFLPREMDVLTKINHPHLIHLHSIYQRKSKFFIFMRFAEKGDLLDHILAHGEVKENQARLWGRQLALGLQYLHELDIVHRDIKCENVLITANNNVKLADFGFARFIVDSTGKRYLSSTYCGSLAYAAPELLKGKPYDPKNSDIWSLGVVLYVMLNQCMPFNDADMKKLYELQMSSKWSFRAKIAAIITEDVKTLIIKMLEPIAIQRITIDDVVNCSWFSIERRLKDMTQREKEALDLGMKNKSGLLPKTQKLNIPSWKKRKKEEQQLVCVTSLRFERSSNQFSFDLTTPTKTQGERVAATTVAKDVPTTSKDVPTTSKDSPATISKEASKDVPIINKDGPTTTSRDVPTNRKDVGLVSKDLTVSKDPTAASKDAMRSKIKGKQSEIRVSENTKSKIDHENRKGRDSTYEIGRKRSEEAIQKTPKENIGDDGKKKSEEAKRHYRESETDDRKKRLDSESKKVEGSPSGAGVTAVKARISKADKFMSLDEMPSNVSTPTTPRMTEPRTGAAPGPSQVTESKVGSVSVASPATESKVGSVPVASHVTESRIGSVPLPSPEAKAGAATEASQAKEPKTGAPGEPTTIIRLEGSQVSGFIKATKAETLAEISPSGAGQEYEQDGEERLSDLSDDE